jgi:hypothetical protein
MPFKTQPIRNMKTGKEDTEKRTPRLANVKCYNLDALVEFSLDNNYIEGAKYELAKGIVKGVIEAERALVKMGNAVSIDGWVKLEPRLKGSVDAKKRTITAENQIIVGVTALKEMKLSINDFSFTCIDDDLKPKETGPVIKYAYSAGHEDDRDSIFYDEANTLHIVGERLSGAAVKVTYTDSDGDMTIDVPADRIMETDAGIAIDGDWLVETLPSGLSADVTFTVATAEGEASVTLKHE